MMVLYWNQKKVFFVSGQKHEIAGELVLAIQEK
jgi:hypothetical protein